MSDIGTDDEADPAAVLAAIEAELRDLYDAPCDTPGRLARIDQLEHEARAYRTVHASALELIGPSATAADRRALRLSIGEAARELGLSTARVRQLDAECRRQRVSVVI